MSDTLLQARREKICLHLLEEGGEESMAVLGEWCGLKLLVSHQPLSELLEGMVEESLLRWDGTSFSLHSEGRALAEKAKATGVGKRKKKAGASPGPAAEAPPETPATATPEPVVASARVPSRPAPTAPAPTPAASPAAPDEDRGHGHTHDHGHSHGHPDEVADDAPPPPRRSPPPGATGAGDPDKKAGSTQKRGLIARIKCRVKKLLGR